jgi:hypothetical protein
MIGTDGHAPAVASQHDSTSVGASVTESTKPNRQERRRQAAEMKRGNRQSPSCSCC